MNVTQKKYAIARVGKIIAKQLQALDVLDTQTNGAYRDSLDVPLSKVLAAIKSGKVKPFSSAELKKQNCSSCLNNIYDLTPLQKSVDNLGKLEQPESVIIPPMDGTKYCSSIYCYFQTTIDSINALCDKFQELSDDIMLGNDETAMQAIRSAESLT